MADEGGETLHGGGSGVAEPSAQRGGIANLRRPSSTDEAREWGRRGGIASGEARRRRASLRDELVALLTAHNGTVAKAIAVAICKEAKNGNVGAFRAIAQVLGELKEVIGIEGDSLPPPIVLSVHDAGFIEAERERQKREFAEVVDAAYTELMPQGTADGSAEQPETSGPTGQPSVGAEGDGADVAPTEYAEPLQDVTSSPQPPQQQPPPPQPPPRAPRTPSEAAAMRREREARDRSANGGEQGERNAAQPYRAVPVTFPRRQ